MPKMREPWSCFLAVTLTLHLVMKDCSSLNPEGIALQKFRSRVEEDPHGVMASWNPQDGHPCNWSGVHCSGNRVVVLNLKELSLRGTLGPELGGLVHLRALVLSGNEFCGVIPKEIGNLTLLEILDLRNNNLSGEVPEEIAEMQSLKQLLLYNNSFHGFSSFVQKPAKEFEDINLDLPPHSDLGFKSSSSSKADKAHGDNLPARLPAQLVLRISAAQLSQRRLLQDSNLAAPSAKAPVPSAAPVPSTGTGSFPATSPSQNDPNKLAPAPTPVLHSPRSSLPFPDAPASMVPPQDASSKKSLKWFYVIVLPVIALLLTCVTCVLLLCRTKAVTTIGPWKTGLSGQLQKAFVTGVPKLQRSELEGACEDFSNIVVSYPHYTVYKGTLSSGVEIAVVSTVITSSKDWSKHSEGRFRKKVDALSRVNHKNFVNLLGYCEEEEPFMRMMVLEYAPNGTLYEHLHVEEFDHIDWGGRLRIVMGIAYCIQHMHELNPPVAHPNLQSSSIMLSEDGAAKIADMSVWHEVISKERTPKNDEFVDHSEPISTDPAGNVYSFGLLLLEVISGKPPYSEHEGSLVNLALDCIKDNRSIASLLDPTLKSHNETELEIICEAIEDCIHGDPRKRPSMREITTRLREVITISPEAATPRLSPLWWAELEILSVEAS